MVRLFVCIWIPDSLRDRIVEFQKKIKKLPMKTKPVEVENLHLTVTFLGDLDEDEVITLKQKLDSSLKNVSKFHVKLEGLKIIPNENYIRVIGINVKNGDDIPNLIRKVTESIGGKFYETTKLTLCRVKNIENKQLIRDFIQKHRDIEIGTFEVKSIALVKSTLTRRGPIYETIHRSLLK